MERFDVIVVGAGPIGLLTALLLRQLGVKVAILEKHPSRSTQSKASSINAYSMAIWQVAGLIDKALEEGVTIHELIVYWNRRRLTRVNYKNLSSCYDYILGISQPETEKLIEGVLSDYGVTVLRNRNVTDVIQYQDGVVARVDDKEDYAAEYVLGCDGARSSVRELVNIEFRGNDLGVEFFMLDAKIGWSGDLRKVHYYVKEDSFFLIIPQANGNHRIIAKPPRTDLMPRGNWHKDEYQHFADTYGPGGLTIQSIAWESSSKFYSRLATSYRSNRVFLAGDACHLFSPVGGLGMNTGFQDAFNLSWKLAGVIKGQFSPSILDTYESERRPLADGLLKGIEVNTKLLTRLDKDTSGPMSSWMPSVRNRYNMREGFPFNLSGLSQRYASGPLIQGKQGTGNLLPYFSLSEAQFPSSTYDVLDYQVHTLLVYSNQNRLPLISADICRVAIFRPGSRDATKLTALFEADDSWLLIRPDGVVAARGAMGSWSALFEYFNFLILHHQVDSHSVLC